MKLPHTARAALILAVALALGTAANLLSPRRIPWTQDWSNYVADRAREEGIPVIDLARMQTLAAGGRAMIFDARSAADYADGHIPGSLSLPYAEAEDAFSDLRMLLTRGDTIVVYCSGRECDESLLLGTFLQRQGFTNVLLYAGGYTQWAAATDVRRRP